MNRKVLIAAAVLTLHAGSPAFAQQAAATPEIAAAFVASGQKTYADAVRFWRPLAEHGEVTAQYKLGLAYRLGQGVSADNGTAVSWYRKASDQGYAPAQEKLAGMYRSGRGVVQDYAEAVKWYRLV